MWSVLFFFNALETGLIRHKHSERLWDTLDGISSYRKNSAFTRHYKTSQKIVKKSMHGAGFESAYAGIDFLLCSESV